jgi:3-oxoacyl-[acyl-carrier-protein] synthase-3
MNIGITGLGAHLPETVRTNPPDDARATGVLRRHVAAPHTRTSDLALPAARAALSVATPSGPPGAIVVATCTPDHPQPATAAVLQHRLALDGCPAFDLNAVSSGFLYGLATTHALLTAHTVTGPVLLVGADLFTPLGHPDERASRSIFGDAAGAVVLDSVPTGHGIHAIALRCHGAHHADALVPAGGTAEPLTSAGLTAGRHYFTMHPRAVRDYVLATLPDLVAQVTDRAGWHPSDIDHYVFHQATGPLLDGLTERLDIPPDRVHRTIHHTGNTSAASIPVALADLAAHGGLTRGSRLILAAAGGGFTAAATALTWY